MKQKDQKKEEQPNSKTEEILMQDFDKNDQKDLKKNSNVEVEPDFKELYLRALADYKNLEKRTDSERVAFQTRILLELMRKMIPFLDNIEQAVIFNKDPGLQMIRKSFLDILKSMGLQELDLLHKKFDPNTAEVIAVEDGESDDKIVEVIGKAYMLNGFLVRPAKVKVSKKIN
jgi:molecular chaperone GrpE